ncbi:MAG: hypothetical protein HC772_01050 [Leptolyngbyaceae cyanobacterium CRU_2_3]|nr:hypothetical protein [Leptolyngbyaceae cyanobacterium CRU_2_3]
MSESKQTTPVTLATYQILSYRSNKDGDFPAAECTEIHIPQTLKRQMGYAVADKRHQFRIAAENPCKNTVVQRLLKQESRHRILIIGKYLAQLKQLAVLTELPVVMGKTSQSDHDRLYEQFRAGTLSGLILSRVGN